MTQRLFNLARMTVSSSGAGVVTLNSAVSGFATFAQTGVPAAGTVSYAISDTNQSEIGVGIYSSGGLLTLGSTGGGATRTPIMNHTGTSSAINMSNAAQIFITPNVTDWPLLLDVAGTTATNPSALIFTFNLASGASTTLGTTTSYFGVPVVSNVMSFGNNALSALVLQNTAGGANEGPGLQLYQNSATPAANDTLGYIEFFGNNNAAAVTPYIGIHGFLQDPANGVEDGTLSFFIRKAGSISIANPADLALWVADTGNGSPGHVMHIESANGTFMVKNADAGAAGVILGLYQNSATPAANDVPGMIAFYGRDSAANFQLYSRIYSFISDATSTSEDALLIFSNVVAGATTDLGYFGAGLVLDTPAGGDKGLGTINATGVYENNVHLTCYPWEAAQTGTVDLKYWDSKANLERHEPARKFAARLGTQYDPTKIAGQRKHINDKRHMTMYPNPDKWTEETRPSTGHLLQCGMEADELLMLYIMQLEDRLAVLETK